ncbi:MAG: glycosyltransferase family 4 protein [Bacteroidota bacterium]|nr:glycosyltransferase family 4 protein [Bacteroidota bacterium]
MVIGIAGPMSLELINFDYGNRKIPAGYPFPMISFFINALIKRGHRVVAYTFSKEIEEPIVFESEKITICVGRWSEHPGRNFFQLERKDLLQLIRKHPAEIINAHWTYEFALAALSSEIPSVITIHDHAWTIFKLNPIPYRFTKVLMNFVSLSKTKYMTANSQYIYTLLSKNKKQKTKIIPDFYKAELEKYSKEHCTKKNYFITISNGFGKRKNIESSIAAFALLKNKYSDYEYHILGIDMENGGPAYRYAEANNYLDGIRFLGPQTFENVIREIREAKACIHPSREESFGMSVLESMVLGTAVIGGTKSGNIPSLLENGRSGLLCDIENPSDIAAKVELLVDNSELRENIEKRAYIYAKENYSEEVVISKFISLYQEIINNNL